jgi:hypothetical protein
MRALAFREPDARRRLEAILHPMIRAESARRCLAAGGPYVILAVPLLVESGGYRERCDRICVVDCPEALQIERVRARSGLADEQIRAIMAAQASRAQRLAAADDVIDNAGTIAIPARTGRSPARRLPRRWRRTETVPRRGGERACAIIGANLNRCDTGGHAAVISYEYPLNERIRTLLRLEDLFDKIAHFTAGERRPWSTMSRCSPVRDPRSGGRADLKVDLVQELERQRQILMSFRNNPDISEEALPARSTRSSRPRPGCSRWRARSASTCARTSG